MRKELFINDMIFQNNSYGEIKKFLEHNNIKNMEFILEPDDSVYFEKMVKIIETVSLERIAFHGPYKSCNLSDSSEESWEKILEVYNRCFEIVKKYKGEYIILHTSEYYEEDTDTALLKAKIRKLVELGKKQGVNVVLENVGLKESAIFSEKKYIQLLKQEEYKTVLDIGHADINNWNIFQFMRENSNLIESFHLHTNDGEKDLHQSISKNGFNLEKFIQLYRENNLKSRLIFEYAPTVDKKLLLEDIKTVESLLNNI